MDPLPDVVVRVILPVLFVRVGASAWLLLGPRYRARRLPLAAALDLLDAHVVCGERLALGAGLLLADGVAVVCGGARDPEGLDLGLALVEDLLANGQGEEAAVEAAPPALARPTIGKCGWLLKLPRGYYKDGAKRREWMKTRRDRAIALYQF